MPRDERSILRVEGRDDKFVIENLLRRHDVDFGHVEIKPTEEGEVSGGKDRLLQGMRTAVITSTGRAVGFVLDADSEPEHRWQAVRQRLDDIDVVLPEEIPNGGFVGDTLAYQVRVGVWLMPDNRRSGALEEFLTDLVADEDRKLLLLARAATRGAVCLGAGIGKAGRRKAVLAHLAGLATKARPAVWDGDHRSVLGTRTARQPSDLSIGSNACFRDRQWAGVETQSGCPIDRTPRPCRQCRRCRAGHIAIPSKAATRFP